MNGYDITATEPKTLGKITVLDSSVEYKAWMQQVINENTDASMTKPEKMQAICKYIVKTGHYPDCLTDEALNEADVHDREYQALYTGSPVLDALVRLTGMPLDRMHYLPKELRKYTKKHYG